MHQFGCNFPKPPRRVNARSRTEIPKIRALFAEALDPTGDAAIRNAQRSLAAGQRAGPLYDQAYQAAVELNIVEHLEQSGFEIDEPGQAIKKRPPVKPHGRV